MSFRSGAVHFRRDDGGGREAVVADYSYPPSRTPIRDLRQINEVPDRARHDVIFHNHCKTR